MSQRRSQRPAVFDAAYAAFIPSVAGEANIAAAAAKLALGSSIAEAAGSSAAGGLIMLVGAPVVILTNVVTFVFSTLAIAAIRVDDPLPARPAQGRSIVGDLRDGITCIVGHPVLRRVTLSNAIAHLGGGMAATVATVYIYRDLHLSPMTLGIVMGLANAGAAAAWYADRIAGRFGVRRTFAVAHLTSAAGKALLPFLAGMFPVAAVFISRTLLTAAGPVFAVNETSLRLSLVPAALRGRATATARAIVWSALPTGSLAGGYLGERVGLSATILIGAATTAFAVVFLPNVPPARCSGNVAPTASGIKSP